MAGDHVVAVGGLGEGSYHGRDNSVRVGVVARSRHRADVVSDRARFRDAEHRHEVVSRHPWEESSGHGLAVVEGDALAYGRGVVAACCRDDRAELAARSMRGCW